MTQQSFPGYILELHPVFVACIRVYTMPEYLLPGLQITLSRQQPQTQCCQRDNR
jgi:hypothetical protein